MTIQSLQHAKNRKAYLERMLAQDPGDQYYMGESDLADECVERDNEFNNELREYLRKGIAECDEYINTHLCKN